MPRVRLDILRIESEARPDTGGYIITDQFKCVYCLGTGVVANSRAYKVRLVLGLLLAWLFVAIFYDLYSRALAPGHPIVEFLDSSKWMLLILAAYHLVGIVRPKPRKCTMCSGTGRRDPGPIAVQMVMFDGQGADTGKCRRCEYDLRGNVSGICPECGTPIRPDTDGVADNR